MEDSQKNHLWLSPKRPNRANCNLDSNNGSKNYGDSIFYTEGIFFPIITALCVGVIIMLLNNKVVEEDLMNGSVGVCRDICYKSREK